MRSLPEGISEKEAAATGSSKEAHMRVVSPQEMAGIDRAAIEERGIPGLDLMENAGGSVARAAMEMLGGALSRRVAIWCGKGNNGGDGLVAARLLWGSGVDVTVFLPARPEDLSGDAGVNYERLEGLSVDTVVVGDGDDLRRFKEAEPGFDLVIDAIFGTGFSGTPEGLFEKVIDALNDYDAPVLAVDIPSGVSGANGAVPGKAVEAEVTVTFACPKLGLLEFPGAGMVGEMQVADIGIPADLCESIPAMDVFLTEEEDVERLLPRRPRDAHKWQCGSVLVVGGSPGMTGAAALCSRGALRAGCGIVTAAVPEGVHQVLEVKLTECMTRPVPQGAGGGISSGAVETILQTVQGYDVVAIGPGLSREEESATVARSLLERIEKPVVLDADGLNAVSGHTELLARRKGPTVITPHPGEMARLADCSSSEVQKDRVGTALRSAARWNSVVVLKGAHTVVAGPDGSAGINPTGNRGMATAGMGDVLTGCIASLVAQGAEPFSAAVCGVYIHGLAADLAASMDGEIGMTAGDVVRHLPLALRRNR